MNQTLKNILIANPFATFFVNKREEVFISDADRKRPAGIRYCAIVMDIPEHTRETTMRRDGKLIRLGKCRTPDISTLHQMLMLDQASSFMLKMSVRTATLKTMTSSFTISRATVEALIGQRPTFGEQLSVSRAVIIAYILKQVYDITI